MRILIMLISVGLLLSCNSKNETGTNSTADKTTDSVSISYSYPYKATYSSDVVVPSHPEYAQKVLKVWKFFEAGNVDSMKQYYADTVTYEPANGQRFHGKAGDLLYFAEKNISESLDSMRFDISTWQSVHVTDKNEDWVYVWAAERKYPKRGKADTILIHEQWKIENGKIVYFNQYKATPPK
ncbi:MAG TPA: nuclear transport factor 2 family protein [Chitinophagaceae bacterium]|nr:nuclear transport factor 2 family protein [Chitinophagaceae bacterium]